MACDLIIRNGTLALADGEIVADIAIAGEKIVEIGASLTVGSRREIDAAGMDVLPGVIDSHVHFNEPGRTDWEGIATGSSACAAGGTTCFFDMPLNASPPTLDAESFDLKLGAMKKSARVDFGLWGGLTPGNIDQLEALAERGVVGFKAFMCGSGIDDFCCADENTLRAGMGRAAQLRLPVAVHAESETMTAALSSAACASGKRSPRDFTATRPIAAEVEAIRQACDLAGETSCRLHIVHVSSSAGVREVLSARSRGVDVSCETCPHYLLFSDDDLEMVGSMLKCAPPLRPSVEVAALRAELLKGNIDFLASDHSPSPPAMKRGDDFFKCWGGIAGCQSLLAAAATAGAGIGLSMPSAAKLTSENVARRYRIAGKGSIQVGFDADLVMLDRNRHTLSADDLKYRHRVSPYVGKSFRAVTRTLVRGHTVFPQDAEQGTQFIPQLIRPQRNYFPLSPAT